MSRVLRTHPNYVNLAEVFESSPQTGRLFIGSRALRKNLHFLRQTLQELFPENKNFEALTIHYPAHTPNERDAGLVTRLHLRPDCTSEKKIENDPHHWRLLPHTRAHAQACVIADSNRQGSMQKNKHQRNLTECRALSRCNKTRDRHQ